MLDKSRSFEPLGCATVSHWCITLARVHFSFIHTLKCSSKQLKGVEQIHQGGRASITPEFTSATQREEERDTKAKSFSPDGERPGRARPNTPEGGRESTPGGGEKIPHLVVFLLPKEKKKEIQKLRASRLTARGPNGRSKNLHSPHPSTILSASTTQQGRKHPSFGL